MPIYNHFLLTSRRKRCLPILSFQRCQIRRAIQTIHGSKGFTLIFFGSIIAPVDVRSSSSAAA